MVEQYAFDVFLSHSSKDKTIVRELAQRLKADGLRVWLDEWEIMPGDMIGERVEAGLEGSRVLIFAISRHSLESEWARLETKTFRFHDQFNEERRFVPVRLDDADVTENLRRFAYVDWRERSDDEYAKLMAVCSSFETRPMPTNGSEDVGTAAVLKGHRGAITAVAITDDGRRAVSGSRDNTVHVWDLEAGKASAVLEGHTDEVWAVAITPDGCRAISGADDKTLRVWDLDSMREVAVLEGHTDEVWSVAITADGRRAVSASRDLTVRVWDVDARQAVAVLEGHTEDFWEVAITADGRRAISGSDDKTVIVWDLVQNVKEAVLKGHTNCVLSVAITPDGRRAVSGSRDRTVRVWDVNSGEAIAVLGGHTDEVWGVAISADGRLAASGSQDDTVRIWDLLTGKAVAVLEGHTNEVLGVAITADGSRAISGSHDATVRVWDLLPISEAIAKAREDVCYTNAKVLLVGESGVGKTGLAHRLTKGLFQETVSTDGAWATQLSVPHAGVLPGVDREIWLWDFAGQSDYRLIHQLFMDETALAVLVFNPQSEDPFDGLAQWDRAICKASRGPVKKLLVAGRCDRMGLTVSRESIDAFRRERDFVGYVETSARTGAGCDLLREALVDNISWSDIPWTTSPRIFRLLKEEIIKMRDQGRVLLRTSELKQHLEMSLPFDRFSPDQLMAVVRLLAGPGIVWQLDFGDFVLLQPERINKYAAAVVRSVRDHVDEIGCIAESDLLAGRLDFQDTERLQASEEQIILRAMHQMLIDRRLCLREHTDRGSFLVFPSYFKRERPPLEGNPQVLVTYRFVSDLDEVYATLVVKLHHATAFKRDQLWRYAADFKTEKGQKFGFKMARKREGLGELEVYFESGISVDLQAIFMRYVYEHLQTTAQEVVRVRSYICLKCKHRLEDRAIELRLRKGFADIACSICEERVLISDSLEERFVSQESERRANELDEVARISIDNESRELILVGHTYAIVGEAGQIFRQYSNSDHGIDGEIEFKDYNGEASGKRLYLQLKSGDSYLYRRKRDGKEVFTIKNVRHADYWQRHAHPVMLVIRTSDGMIRWCDIGDYLKRESDRQRKLVKQVVFEGEPFSALSVLQLRDRELASS